MIDDLHALRVFLAVGSSGSMTGAARRLGLTQSAVSQSVRHLEEILGTVLLDRSGRPLRLTAAGTVLQHRAAALVEDASSIATIVRQVGAAGTTELRIGMIDSFASTVGPHLIRKLLPEVARLSFRSGLAYDQTEGLLNRNLDMIISSDTMDDVDGLDRQALFTEPFLLLLPDRLAGKIAKPQLDSLVSSHPFIRFSARSSIGAQIERHLRRLGVRAPPMLEVDATDALFAVIAAGLGWAIATPLCVLQAKSYAARIRVLPFPTTGFVRQFHLFSRAGELGALPERVAQLARDLLAGEAVPELLRMVPWLRDKITVDVTRR